MNKFALLIGINYVNSENQLYGCVNDIINVKNILEQKYQFKNIKILSEINDTKPTRKNIENELQKLLLLKNTKIIVHYSGHGSQLKSRNNDELDNLDEVLIPLDFKKNGIIKDDYLYSIFSKLEQSNTLLFICDCCHSGSILDLKFNYKITDDYKKFYMSVENSKELFTNIVSISGCLDAQTSADAYINNKNQGAFTYSLLQCNFSQPLYKLLIDTNNQLKKNKFEQKSQLAISNNNLLNYNFDFFLL